MQTVYLVEVHVFPPLIQKRSFLTKQQSSFLLVSKPLIWNWKYIPHKVDVPSTYLLTKQSHSSGSKYFSRCLYMMFALVWMHFEVNFHISKPFGFSNIRRRWNGATSFGPLVFDIDFSVNVRFKYLEKYFDPLECECMIKR